MLLSRKPEKKTSHKQKASLHKSFAARFLSVNGYRRMLILPQDFSVILKTLSAWCGKGRIRCLPFSLPLTYYEEHVIRTIAISFLIRSSSNMQTIRPGIKSCSILIQFRILAWELPTLISLI